MMVQENQPSPMREFDSVGQYPSGRTKNWIYWLEMHTLGSRVILTASLDKIVYMYTLNMYDM